MLGSLTAAAPCASANANPAAASKLNVDRVHRRGLFCFCVCLACICIVFVVLRLMVSDAVDSRVPQAPLDDEVTQLNCTLYSRGDLNRGIAYRPEQCAFFPNAHVPAYELSGVKRSVKKLPLPTTPLPRSLRSGILNPRSGDGISLVRGNFCNASVGRLETLICDRNGFAMLSQCHCVP